MVMYKIITVVIFTLALSSLKAQTRGDSLNVIFSLVNNDLLVGLFNHDLVKVVDAVDEDPQLVMEKSTREGEEVLWTDRIAGEDYAVTYLIYCPDNTVESIEFSKIWIEFTSAYTAKRFLRYFAPVARFSGNDEDYDYHRKMQTARLLEDHQNVVFFWLTYPRL